MKIEMGGHAARMGEGRVAYRNLMGRYEERIPLGRPRIYKRLDRGRGARTGLIWLRIRTDARIL
jgi:hypothetical protein